MQHDIVKGMPEFVAIGGNEEIYRLLFEGVRSKVDPVTWRTLIITSRVMLGSIKDPDNVTPEIEGDELDQLAYTLLSESWLEPMMPEYMADVSGIKPINKLPSIKTLLINGRHMPEPLIFTLADKLDDDVAVVNPVGHYNDEETRILVPGLLRPVKKLVVVASTQAQRGGSYEVLDKVCSSVGIPAFAPYIEDMMVLIPMAGGSRGHRDGQNFGGEVREATFNPHTLALVMDEVRTIHRRDYQKDLKIRFASVDIHHDQSFRDAFEAMEFEFMNIDSAKVLARGVLKHVLDKRKELGDVELTHRFIACDQGAVQRTQNLVREVLRLAKEAGLVLGPVELVYLRKNRIGGKVERVWVNKVESCELREDEELRLSLVSKPILSRPIEGATFAHFSDDMLDTGSTLKNDTKKIQRYYPGVLASDLAATHAVLSKGPGVLDSIGIDRYIFTNTLAPDGLTQRDDIEIVDVSPAIVEVL